MIWRRSNQKKNNNKHCLLASLSVSLFTWAEEPREGMRRKWTGSGGARGGGWVKVWGRGDRKVKEFEPNVEWILPILYSWTGVTETRCKGLFTRYDSVACDKLATGLRHELYRVNQTYYSLTTVVHVTKNVVGF